MNSMERVVTALQHKQADRVPVYPIISGASRRLIGASYEEWANNADVCSRALLKAREEFELDCIVTLIDLSIECDAWGQKLIYPADEAAHPDYSECIIQDIEDYVKIKKVDYTTSRRMMMHIDTCKKLVEGAQGEFPVIAFVFGPLGILSMLRNQQDMYMDLYDDPDAVKEAARQINETLKDYCRALMKTGVNGIMLDTLFASGSIMSKDMWREMEGDLCKELADVIREEGGLVMVHNCGQKIYFDVQIETMNPCAISFLYPPDDCKDFVECKEKYGDQVTLIGCVTPASAAIGTDENWIEECKQSMDAMMKGGGFMLATGCEYPANAAFDRAKMMVELAKTHGKYNL
ncbi:uroporphyrinogen decarboxylase [Sporanaerobium hydrogeniformans]|uniref:Uroporphyrinogen decarboxylase n=1 Tax=Sporanaerobium hydrogeniformans TaxID=3072179 RepID=A0AC61DEH0_9FIRM|nr:uroporphyrinogen decarboxylase family protein [Sporanaerobium hydrogeniformans]PHV71699.1 uroporphyrinogen decarboxylase [Sporanaerobium hydrogeniformans]